MFELQGETSVHHGKRCSLLLLKSKTSLFFKLSLLQEKEQKPLKEGVQDMLVKHHLFSWDIDG